MVETYYYWRYVLVYRKYSQYEVISYFLDFLVNRPHRIKLLFYSHVKPMYHYCIRCWEFCRKTINTTSMGKYFATFIIHYVLIHNSDFILVQQFLFPQFTWDFPTQPSDIMINITYRITIPIRSKGETVCM